MQNGAFFYSSVADDFLPCCHDPTLMVATIGHRAGRNELSKDRPTNQTPLDGLDDRVHRGHLTNWIYKFTSLHSLDSLDSQLLIQNQDWNTLLLSGDFITYCLQVP